MSDLPALKSLLERVETAEGPDRKLDGEIFAAFETYSYGDVIPAAGGMVVYAGPAPHAPGQGRFEVAPKYTSSLDASLALVEEMLPGWDWSLHCDNGTAIAGIMPPSEDGCDTADCEAVTPALAIVKALLRALIAQKETADV